MSVTIQGLDKLLAKLDKIPDKLEDKMVDAVHFLEEVAEAKAPKDTGRLIGSIESKVERSGSDVTGIVFTPTEYAPYQEFGTGLFAVNGDGRKTPWAYEDPKTGETVWTRGNRPHPFMGPALRENKDVVLAFLKEGVDV
jgi:HK97 gp10 family phage protein